MKKRILAAIITVGLLMGVTSTAQGKEFNNIDNGRVNKILEVSNLGKATQTGKVINVTTNLRIREKPSTSSNILGQLYGGQTVKIVSKSGNWYEVEINSIKGYVSADYIAVTGDNSNNNQTNGSQGNNSSEQSGNSGQVVNVSSILRIRQSASTSSSIIGSLRNGEKFEILSKINGWYKINANGKIGYVHGDYVKVLSDNSIDKGETNSKPDNNSSNKIGTGKVVNVTTSLRMRSDASTSSSIIGTLYSGNTFDIHGEKNGWHYIKFNGKFGYVHGNYVQKTNEGSNGESNNNSNNSESNQGKYEAVLNAMKKNLGTPYVFGGSGEIITDSLISSLKNKFPGQQYDVPSQYRNGNYRAFDCSGLMQWGFKQAGINLGRTTYDQVKAGQAVSRGNIKPGDLVFYSDLNHVGMYVGDGKWLESPRTRSQVRIADIPWSKIGQIRRVL